VTTKTLGKGPNGISRDLKFFAHTHTHTHTQIHTHVYPFKQVNISDHTGEITNNAKDMQL
jgi:hypothetical protein